MKIQEDTTVDSSYWIKKQNEIYKAQQRKYLYFEK